MESLRKRNASDGDSGFDSALSSRSSSISLEESQDLLDFKVPQVEASTDKLRGRFSYILHPDEDIHEDVSTPGLFLIKDRVSGAETLYKPPRRLSFSQDPPQVETTYSRAEYSRCNPIPRSQLFNARLQLELEKQVTKMESVEVDLLMDTKQVPPPSLGIRVIGVNMIHGVPDKLNIYVKKVVEDSVAGQDGRIQVNDHIVEVNGVSLVGVSQKLAAEALSSCAVNPETGIVSFVLARAPQEAGNEVEADMNGNSLSLNPNLKPPGLEPNPKPPTAAAAGEPTPPPPPIVSPAICGQSQAFIPRLEKIPDNKESAAEPAAGLGDLPGPLLGRVLSHLPDRRDRASLARLNKSFYLALKEYLPSRCSDSGGGGGLVSAATAATSVMRKSIKTDTENREFEEEEKEDGKGDNASDDDNNKGEDNGERVEFIPPAPSENSSWPPSADHVADSPSENDSPPPINPSSKLVNVECGGAVVTAGRLLPCPRPPLTCV